MKYKRNIVLILYYKMRQDFIDGLQDLKEEQYNFLGMVIDGGFSMLGLYLFLFVLIFYRKDLLQNLLYN